MGLVIPDPFESFFYMQYESPNGYVKVFLFILVHLTDTGSAGCPLCHLPNSLLYCHAILVSIRDFDGLSRMAEVGLIVRAAFCCLLQV